MYTLIIIYFYVHSVLGNFYFTSSDTRLYATRDIKNFDQNLENLSQLINNLSRQHDLVPTSAYHKYLKNLEGNKKKFMYFSNIVSKGNHNNTINSMIQQTHSLIGICVKDLKQLYHSSSYNYYLAITNARLNSHMDDHVFKRKKRGIKLLGSLISALMDLPGPDDFLHQVSISNDLSAIVKGSLVPGIKKLSHSIAAEKNFLNDIIPVINNSIIESEDISSLFDLALDLLRDQNYLIQTCLRTSAFARSILNESVVLKSIHTSSLENKASPYMFPSHFLNNHLNNIHLASGELDSYTHSNHELLNLQTCYTVFENFKIHSMLSIPNIDRTFHYKFLAHPLLNSKDSHTIHSMEKHALRKLDYFGCNDKQNSILLYSSKDLLACKKFEKSSSYLCFKRQIALFSGPKPCYNFHLENSLAVELSRTVILLKTNLTFVYIECSKNITKLPIKSSCYLHYFW